jgi:hypothetical protein
MNGFINCAYSGCDDNNANIIAVPWEWPIYPIEAIWENIHKIIDN